MSPARRPRLCPDPACRLFGTNLRRNGRTVGRPCHLCDRAGLAHRYRPAGRGNRRPLGTLLERPFPGVRFLTFGFGERQFLVNREESFGAMLDALLPSQSALLMTALGPPPAGGLRASRTSSRCVSPVPAWNRSRRHIWREFELLPPANRCCWPTGPIRGSVFYAARDTYDGFYTCNTWTAISLRAGGVPMPASRRAVLRAGHGHGTLDRRAPGSHCT